MIFFNIKVLIFEKLNKRLFLSLYGGAFGVFRLGLQSLGLILSVNLKLTHFGKLRNTLLGQHRRKHFIFLFMKVPKVSDVSYTNSVCWNFGTPKAWWFCCQSDQEITFCMVESLGWSKWKPNLISSFRQSMESF